MPALMILTFAFTLFVSAVLLFLVQPMMGKMILPTLGGTPAVWNTCMVFFQALLLAGYAYAHATTAWLGARKQAALHLALLLSPLLFFPVLHDIDRGLVRGGDQDPIPVLLRLLFLSVGLPFFVVSTSAPLLQKWFASTDHPAARDPYFLYGASNLGSMLGLIGYPALVEPMLRLADQRTWWGIGYGLLVLLTAACAVLMWKSPVAASQEDKETRRQGDREKGREAGKKGPVVTSVEHQHSVSPSPPLPLSTSPARAVSAAPDLSGMVTWGRRVRWIALALVPSSLMLGVTTYITTDIAAIPLLWVLPLGLYLLSFILVFSRIPGWVHQVMVALMPLLVLMIAFLTLSGIQKPPVAYDIGLHLTMLFFVAMVCHGELARDRPSTKYLTEFYLLMSFGGMLGGMFNALVAPLVFQGIAEYPLAMALACLLLPPLSLGQESFWGRYVDLALVALFFVAGVALIALRLGDPNPNYRLDFAAVAPDQGSWYLVAIVIGLAGGLAVVFRKRDNQLSRVLDLALPVTLGILVLGLAWGLRASTMEGKLQSLSSLLQLKIGNRTIALNFYQLRAVLSLGLPAVLCYTFVDRPLRFGLGVGALLLASGYASLVEDPPTFQTRSFFGVLKVEKGKRYVRLVHGHILHGKQFLDEDRRDEPLTYYHRTGPIGQVMAAYNTGKDRNLAVVGLGSGTLACYGLPGQHLTFYDIDKKVRDISFNQSKYFTYVSDARERGVDVELVLGDARLTMERQQLAEDQKYDVLAVDAFSSDAIPIHLITQEALDMYLTRMKDSGIIAFHISNRFLNLKPVLANLAQARNLACLVESDGNGDESEDPGPEAKDPGKSASSWLVLARDPKYLARLPQKKAGQESQDSQWEPVATDPKVGVWTDDYSNLLSVFLWGSN